MQDNTVAIEPGPAGSRLRFAPRFNVAAAFIDRHLAEGRSAKIAIRTATEELSYAALAEGVGRCGNALLGLGIPRGGRLLMAVLDGPAFFYLFWGAIKAGIVPVPLNTLLRAADYAYMIEDSACSGLIYAPELAGEIEPALAQAQHRPPVVLRTVGDRRSLQGLMGEAPAALDPVPAGPEDDCFWLYSSGSTGRPKGAVHAQRDLAVASQYYGVDTLGARADDVFFSAAKLFFAYGLGNAMGFPLWVGGTAVLMADRPTPESTFAAIERFRPTLFFGVPTLYAHQIAALAQRRPDLSSVRYCVSAGEALPAHIGKAWKQRFGLDIVNGVGSSEMGHLFLTNLPNAVEYGTSGVPVDGYKLRLIDENGSDVGDDEIGELLVSGESSAAGYWNQREKSRRTFLGEWTRTGDKYLRRADGVYTFCGRADDMFKVSGIWVSPFEVEEALMSHPTVAEAAVVPAEDDDGLIKPKAFIVLDQGCDQDAGGALYEELKLHVKRTIGPWKYPRWIEFVDSLPKTATGKLQRYMLRDQNKNQTAETIDA